MLRNHEDRASTAFVSRLKIKHMFNPRHIKNKLASQYLAFKLDFLLEDIKTPPSAFESIGNYHRTHITCREADIQHAAFANLQAENARLRALLNYAGVSPDVVKGFGYASISA